MAPRKPATTQEIVDQFLAYPLRTKRAVLYSNFVYEVQRAQRTTGQAARRWVDAALSDPKSQLVGVRTTSGRVWATDTLPTQPMLTSGGLQAESEDQKDDRADAKWVILKTTLADMAKRETELARARDEERQQKRIAELATFRQRYGDDSIRLLRGLLNQAGITSRNALAVHYYDDKPVALGPTVTLNLYADIGGQDQIALFLDLIRALGVQPIPKKAVGESTT